MKALSTISALALSFSLISCGNEVQYDPKALGFADKAEMEAAFAKGYHTKQKLTEMFPPAPKAESPAQFTPSAASPATEQSVPQQVAQAPETQQAQAPVEQSKEVPVSRDVPDAANCSDVKACVNAMLAAAKVENLAAAMDAARRIDGFDKPARGDRKLARKLNAEALAVFKQGNNLEAINLLTKAREADKLDEEIASNIVHVYSEDGNYTKAIALSVDAFLLNPRRASLWAPYALANFKAGNQQIAFQAMWLAWQFSANKEKMLAVIDKKISEESDAALKSFYTTSRAWLVENKKPSF